MTLSYKSVDLNVSAWKTISAIDVALYTVFLLLIIWPCYQIACVSFKKFARPIIMNILIILTKIAGCAVMLYLLLHLKSVSSQVEINLVIASTVLINIAMGLILTNISKMIEYVNHEARGTPVQKMKLKEAIATLRENIPGTRVEAIEAIYWRIVMLTVILASTANGLTYKHFETSRALAKASSILYIVELLILACLIANAFRAAFNRSSKRYLKLILSLSAIDTVFLTVRIAASVASAFTMSRTDGGFPQSTYSFFFGNWKWYAFLSFMPETIAVGIWVPIMWCLEMHMKYENVVDEMEEGFNKPVDELV